MHGRIVDANGALIPGMRVSLKSATAEFNLTSNKAGRFDFEVPSGIYELGTTSNNTHPFARATIKLVTGEHQWISIRPVFRQLYTENDVVKFKRVRLDDGTTALIQYRNVTEDSTGFRFVGQDLSITMGYLTLYANEMKCVPSLQTCTLDGRVSGEMQEEPISGTRATVDLTTRRVLVSRMPIVEYRF